MELMRLISTEAEQQTVEMSLSRVMLTEIVKPRLRAQIVRGLSAEPTRASGKMVIFDSMRRASVLSSFGFSLFCVIKVFTPEMHVCVVKTVACI